MQAPSPAVKQARLVTLNIDTGPDGDNDPQRTLATIQTVSAQSASAIGNDSSVPNAVGPAWRQRFENLATARVTAKRTLYFSENNPLSQFFITENGATPTLFDPNNPPAIVTTQGSVEDWTIQNRTLENHEFHIHQIHFLVLSQNNFQTNGSQPDASLQGQFLEHRPGSLLGWQPETPLSQCRGADGLPRTRCRRLRLSLPYRRARGWRDDDDRAGHSRSCLNEAGRFTTGRR